MTDEIFETRGACSIKSLAEFDTNYNNLGQHYLSSIANAIMSDWRFDRQCKRQCKNNIRYKRNNKQKENE